MASDTATVAAEAGYDEDWWTNNNGKSTFVEIPSTINGVMKRTRWWTSYWFNQEPGNKGYYVWGYTYDGGPPQFDSIFDPAQSVAQQPNGVLVKVRRNGNDAPYTAELVLEGTDPGNRNSHPGFGYYAVTGLCSDFGSLDPNVVLGVFTFQFGKSAEGPNVHREIDLLETIAGYQQTDDRNNAQFALQPASADHNGLKSGLRFTIPKGLQTITTFMRWGLEHSNSYPTISLRIYAGAPTMDDMIKDTSGQKALPGGSWPVPAGPNVPRHKNERMHINFYVPNGRKGKGLPKSDQQVLITHFQYRSA
jgi:hypothetical protein